MAYWQVQYSTMGQVLSEDWRATLIEYLENKAPRRLSPFSELCMLGALSCAKNISAEGFPADMQMRIITRRGALSSAKKAMLQTLADDLMPFSFMQSQSSQALAAVAKSLGWQGNASLQVARNWLDVFVPVLCQSIRKPLLLLWVDEAWQSHLPVSQCLYLTPLDLPSGKGMSSIVPLERLEFFSVGDILFLDMGGCNGSIKKLDWCERKAAKKKVDGVSVV